MTGTRQERKYRRFNLECAVCVKFHAAGSTKEVEAVSKNVSIGGFLVRSPVMIPEHTPVTFILSIQGVQFIQFVYLGGKGEVVRVESRDAAFVIAIKCKTQINQLENCLREV